MDKKSIVNDLYQAAVISVLVVGYSMLGKKILTVSPSSIQRFDLEDTGKLVDIIPASEMTREHLIKQKILPDHINKNKTNDLILNLTPENVTQHSGIVTTTHKGSSTPTKMSKIIGRQIH